MELPRVSKSVVRVISLQKDGSGVVRPVVLFEKDKKKKKKGTMGLRTIGKAVRRVRDAQSTFADNYLDRHDQSNRKRKDGWLRDISLNLARADRKGSKKVKLSSWL